LLQFKLYIIKPESWNFSKLTLTIKKLYFFQHTPLRNIFSSTFHQIIRTVSQSRKCGSSANLSNRDYLLSMDFGGGNISAALFIFPVKKYLTE